ncbi:MAG: hypothetical protein ACI35S_03660 [Anaeroplasma sp.]
MQEYAPAMIPYRTYPDRIVQNANYQSNKKSRGKPKVSIEEKVKKSRSNHYMRKQPTYSEINKYIKNKYGFIIPSQYIAYVKRLHRLTMQTSRIKKN